MPLSHPLTMRECLGAPPGRVSVFAAVAAGKCLEKRRKIGHSSVVFPETGRNFALGEHTIFISFSSS